MAAPSPSPARRNAWWGTFDLPLGAAVHWQIGPLELWLERREREWRVRHRAGDNAIDTTLAVAERVDPDAVPEEAELARYGFTAPAARVSLAPRTPERAVVVRPDAPFVVPVGEESRFYVSTPLWLAILPEGGTSPLLELPSHRPSDTWFGPNTLEGELCYAVTTAARLELASLPFRPHRAVTPVVVRNRAQEPLTVDRLKVPLPYLSLFADGYGRIWTELVTLEQQGTGDLAALQIGHDAPSEALAPAPDHPAVPSGAARRRTRAPAAPGPAELGVVRLCEPRQRPESRVALRAFSRLFRGM